MNLNNLFKKLGFISVRSGLYCVNMFQTNHMYVFNFITILTNDIQGQNELVDPLIQPNVIRGPVNRKKYRQFKNKNKRYIPFYYNPTYPNAYDQLSNSPQFVTVTEEERQQSQIRNEEERQNKNISEIYVTGWEQLEKPQNENSNSQNYPCYTFIIEFIKKQEIYFTKRTFFEFLELFKSLQKHTKYIFPKLAPKQLEGNQTPKDMQEIFSKILQVINSDQIGRHINFYQFLMPKDRLEEFVINQAATFSSNMMETPQSYYQRSSEYTNKFESLRRKCSASPSQQEAVDQQLTHTMSFGQSNNQKTVNIEKLFNKLDNRPKYQHISIVDWDYVDPDENSMTIHGRSSANTQTEEEVVYFFIKFMKYKKNIQNQPYIVKRTIKDLIALRDYVNSLKKLDGILIIFHFYKNQYKLIYENRQFPEIIQQNLQKHYNFNEYLINYFNLKQKRNAVINKDSFRSENGYDSQKQQINQFFEYLIENQLTSLNLRKFLEEGAELYEDMDNISAQNLDSESTQFARNGNLS